MSKARVGVLLLHGLSSHINCIDPVVPRLEKYGLPYRMPVLRGHGTKPADLEGVKWQDWLEDGQKALDDLLQDCEKVIPVALSMGSLVALNLVVRQPEKMEGLVCIAPALKVKSKLAFLAPAMARFVKVRRGRYDPKSYFDQEQAKTNLNYPEMPTSVIVEFLKFAALTRQPGLLARVTTPILILETVHDRVIDPQIARYLHDRVASRDKKLIWYHRSGHEMLRDSQREEVLDAIEAYLVEKTSLKPVTPAAGSNQPAVQ